jgi:hypothetical protein
MLVMNRNTVDSDRLEIIGPDADRADVARLQGFETCRWWEPLLRRTFRRVVNMTTKRAHPLRALRLRCAWARARDSLIGGLGRDVLFIALCGQEVWRTVVDGKEQ